ncbi:hypothetical protein Hte_004638 [Hypoxylon texense]
MESKNLVTYDSGPSKTAESSPGNKIAKLGHKKRIAGALFLVLCISCGIVSQLIPVQRDRDFFDPGCVDEGDDPAERNFNLDLTFGNFTFAQAKLIDMTWDTAVGQGGRLIHGWVLYRTVIHPLLVFAMETSSVTYKFYTTLSFSRASLETLWILLSSLFSTKSYSVLICSIFTVYTIGYTILFPIIFGAATGYINQAHKLYAMPQGDVVSLDSEHLSLCWVIDPLRLGWTNTSDLYVEVGPNFSSIQSMTQPSSYTNAQLYFTIDQGPNQNPKIDSLEYTPGGWKTTTDISIWDRLRDYNGSDTQLNVSRNFANIRACKC